MKFAKDTKTKEEEPSENLNLLDLIVADTGNDNSFRTIGLYGDVDEESSSTLVHSLFSLAETGKIETLKEPENEECMETITTYEPIKLIVSTHGGSAHEMFSIYDTMRLVRENYEIETIGLGKVMSAGVLLLAAGTKGKRRIGANCRIMIHPVSAASMGDLQDLENDTKEIKYLQESYVNSLVSETSMTKKYIKRLIGKKVNIYINAEEAIELGIADKII